MSIHLENLGGIGKFAETHKTDSGRNRKSKKFKVYYRN